MSSRLFRYVIAALLPIALAAHSYAITWHPVEVVCPVCRTQNSFLQWGSYGSYIYQYPSKFQFIFWPYTDSPSLYSCRSCRLTTFMEDFRGVPQSRFPAIRQALRDVRLPQVRKYTDIPMSERLLVAERVYATLERNDEFWCHFYRVLGYHFAAEGKQREADEARRKALDIAQRMFANREHEGKRKELLLISGAMRHFLNDDEGALRDFTEATRLTYRDSSLTQQQADNINSYLSALLAEYMEKIRSGNGPRSAVAYNDSSSCPAAFSSD